MGESYRGLTIKLGADSTELSKALKAVNSAARATQSELKRVTQGLRLEPGNVELASLKMSKLRDYAQDSASKLETLRRAEAQLSGTRIADLAEKTKNAALQTQRANEAYNDVNATLERVNRRIEELGSQVGPFDEATLRAQREEMRALGDEQRRLSQLHERYQAQLDDAKGVERFRNLKVEIAATAAETRDMARKMAQLAAESGDVGELAAATKRVREGLEADEAAAKALRQEFSRLKDAGSSAETAAARMKNLTEQIDVANGRAARLKAAIKGLEDAGIDDAGASMRVLAEQTQAAREEFVRVKAAAAEAAAKVDLVESEMRSLDTAGKGGSERFRELGGEASEARAKVKALEEAEEAASKALDTAAAREQLRLYRADLAETEAAAKRLKDGDAASGVASSMRSVGTSLSATLTPLVLSVGYGVLGAAEDIDSAFRDMKKTVNGTDEDFEALRESAVEFSKTHVTSADTILEIEAMGGQLGIAVDQLEEFAVVASNLDIATDMDAEDIAQTLGQLNNVLGWGEGDMERYADALTRLGNNMPAQESAITDITSRIGSAAHMYGMTTPQILAWSTAIAATGQNSEAAGTAIANSLSDVENAVAGGGDSLQAFADVAGMSADEFAAKWNSDASGAFQDFIDGLVRIEADGGSADVALTQLGITGVRQKQALKGLAQTVGTLDDALQMSQDAWDGVDDRWGSAGDAANEAAQKSEGFSGALGKFKNTLQDLGSEVGETLTPLIEALTQALSKAEELFSSMPDWAKQAAVLAAAAAGAAGPLLSVGGAIGQMATKARNAKSESTKFSGSLKTLKGAATAAKTGLYGLATLIAGKLVEAVANYVQHAENVEKATEGIVDACRNAGGDLSSFVSGVGDAAGEAGGAVSSTTELVNGLVDSVADLADEISGRHSGANSQNYLLDSYRDTIDELGGRSDLTTEQLGRLGAAVEGVNGACGTSYTVAQDAAGAYQVMADGAAVAKDAIDKLVESKMIEAQLSAYQSDYEALVAKEKEAADAVAQAAADYAEAQKKVDEALDMYGYSEGLDALAEAERDGEEAQAVYAGVVASMQTVTSALGTLYQGVADGADAIDRFAANNVSVLTSSLANSKDRVTGMALSMDDLTSALKASGASADDLNELTAMDLATLATNFDGTAASVTASLSQMVDGFSATNEAVAAAALDPERFAGGYQDLAYWMGQAGVSAEQFASLSADQAAGLAEAMNQADGTAQGYVTAMLGYLMSLDGGFADSATTAQDAAARLAECFDPEGNGVAESLNAFAASLDEQGLSGAAQFVSQFAATLSEGASDAAGAAGDINEAVGEVQDEGASEAGEAGGETGEEYAGGVADGEGDASGAAASVADAAEASLADTDTYSLGVDFGQGYVNGILSMVGAASSAGAALGDAGSGGLQAAQDSHSPSKVTRRLGGYFAQGYALGIADDSGLPARSARSMVGDALSSARAAYADTSVAAIAGRAAYASAGAGVKAAASAYRGVTKADVFDAMDAALRANSGGEVAVYVDGRRLAQSISRNMDAELGALSARRAR